METVRCPPSVLGLSAFVVMPRSSSGKPRMLSTRSYGRCCARNWVPSMSPRLVPCRSAEEPDGCPLPKPSKTIGPVAVALVYDSLALLLPRSAPAGTYPDGLAPLVLLTTHTLPNA